MPELPDIEYFKEYVDGACLRKVIAAVHIHEKHCLRGRSAGTFRRNLEGAKIVRTARRGKFLILYCDNTDYKLVFHFGMTGRLAYGKPEHLADAHVVLSLEFENGCELRYYLLRKLGTCYLVESTNEIRRIAQMGREPLAMGTRIFADLLARKGNKRVKALLMSQEDIAGIGNEYSDEILFQAGIHPNRVVRSLTAKERQALYRVMRRVLKRAVAYIRTGSFPKTWLMAHRKDLVCPKDKAHTLKKKKVSGRTAVFCPSDQA